jgi:hypothetical protein
MSLDSFLTLALKSLEEGHAEKIKNIELSYIVGLSPNFISSGIDLKESIPPAYVAWRAGTTYRVIVPAYLDT